jgi:sugar/nucleoside kinase (ribokinase family)
VRLTRIVCVGDVMVDVLARLPGPLALGSDTPASIAMLGGGSAANTAAWLAAAGAQVTLIARVGDAALGRNAVAELTSAGVDLAVTVDPGRPTGTCIVLVDPTGERTMVPSAGANEAVGTALPPIAAGEHLHVSGYPLLRAASSPAIAAALGQARSAGASVSVDAASAAPLRDFGARRFMDLVGAALLFANADEAAVLTDLDDPGNAARRLAEACGEAIVKCGADGAMWSDGVALTRTTVARVHPVDSTGAGDAFAAGVLAAVARGAGITAALHAGHELAGRAIVSAGARPPATSNRPISSV